MIERVGGGDERGANPRRQLVKLAQAAALVAAIGEGRGEIDAAACGGGEGTQALDVGSGGIARRDGDEDLPFARRQHLLEAEVALALDGAAVAVGQQAAQPAVGGAIGGIAGRLEAIAGDKARTDEQANLVLLGGGVGTHHTGQRIAVGNADGGEPQLRRLPDHLVRMRGPAQKREVGGGDQLGEGGHGNPSAIAAGRPSAGVGRSR